MKNKLNCLIKPHPCDAHTMYDDERAFIMLHCYMDLWVKLNVNRLYTYLIILDVESDARERERERMKIKRIYMYTYFDVDSRATERGREMRERE